ncbi:MAG: 30S ribosomal protein S26e, partial [Candidatus Thorarchaeota archaeon]|nr:30S ribosomal protein S26e [Candidatus Thorarchaeota archaeon]
MAKKRKSGGRSKGSSGKGKSVQCSKCGRMVPVDKAKKHTKRVSVV